MRLGRRRGKRRGPKPAKSLAKEGHSVYAASWNRRVKTEIPVKIAAQLTIALVMSLAAPAIARTTPPPERAFRAQVTELVEAEMRLYPERATRLGDHRFDNRVDDLSAHGIDEVVRHAKKWLALFGADDPKSLSSANEADREWLLAHLDGELLWTEQVRSYQRDPGMYLPTASVNGLIKRAFAPAEARMRSVTAREVAALSNLDAARRNLKTPLTPKVYVDITLQQMPATIAFFNKDVPLAFAKVADGPDKQAFAKANANLVAAIEDYTKWLKNDLMPKASGDYAIGATPYRRMLSDADMVDIPLDQLEQIGVKELARLRDEFQKTALLIDPNHSPDQVMESLTRVHPDTAQVLPTVAAGLASIRAYVVAHHIATVPSDVLPMVQETPPYARDDVRVDGFSRAVRENNRGILLHHASRSVVARRQEGAAARSLFCPKHFKHLGARSLSGALRAVPQQQVELGYRSPGFWLGRGYRGLGIVL